MLKMTLSSNPPLVSQMQCYGFLPTVIHFIYCSVQSPIFVEHNCLVEALVFIGKKYLFAWGMIIMLEYSNEFHNEGSVSDVHAIYVLFHVHVYGLHIEEC